MIVWDQTPPDRVLERAKKPRDQPALIEMSYQLVGRDSRCRGGWYPNAGVSVISQYVITAIIRE
jgi:hypothetical protein